MILLTPDEKFCPDPVFGVIRIKMLLSMKSKLKGLLAIESMHRAYGLGFIILFSAWP